MQNQPLEFKKISIIMPVKNGAKYLRRALNSLKIQAYPNLEILACVGKSTDNTNEIFKEYGVPIAYEDNNDRTDAAINGYLLATGEIMGWLMYDDELLPGALHKINAAFQNPEVEWVYAPMNIVNPDGSIFERLGEEDNITLEKMVQKVKIPGCSSFFKKETYLRVGGLSKNHPNTNDYELWLRMLDKGVRPYQIKEDLVVFHLIGTNLGNQLELTSDEVIKLRALYFKKLPLGGKIRVRARQYRAKFKPLLRKLPTADRSLRYLHKKLSLGK